MSEFAYTERDPIEDAQTMSEWFSDYMYGLTNEVGFIPDTLRVRIALLFGPDASVDEAVSQLRDLILEFADNVEDQTNAVLYTCGYPDEALAQLGMGDTENTMRKIEQRFGVGDAKSMICEIEQRFEAASEITDSPLPLESKMAQPALQQTIQPLPVESREETPGEQPNEQFFISRRMHRLMKEIGAGAIDDELRLRASDGPMLASGLIAIYGSLEARINEAQLRQYIDNTYRGLTDEESAEMLGSRASSLAQAWSRFRRRIIEISQNHSSSYALTVLKQHIDPTGERSIEAQSKRPQVTRHIANTAIKHIVSVPAGSKLGSIQDLVDDSATKQWQDKGLCAQTDPEAFFPDKGGSTREAKRICQGCEVRSECLAYALDNDERFGIWGGLSERERRRIKRGQFSVNEALADADTRLEARLIPKPEIAKCIEQFFSIICLEEDRDEEFEAEVSYDDELREQLIDVVFNKLYRQGVENPDEERVRNLQYYFAASSFTGQNAQWYIDNETRLAKDLRGFEYVMQGIHQQYAAIQREADTDGESSVLRLCRDVLEAETTNSVAG